MRITKEGGSYTITGFDHLNLSASLHCGQAFRWRKIGAIEEGVVRGRLLRLEQRGEDILVHPPADSETVDLIIEYIRLDEPHSHMEQELSNLDDVMRRACQHSSGLRLLRQEPFECLISYILSANNSIPLISRAIEAIAWRFGDPICFGDDTYYAFPRPEQLVLADVADINACKAGFRSRSVCEAAFRVSHGQIDLAHVAALDYPQAKEALMSFRGVGEKVADCVLLFSMDKFEAFPVDVWIQRAVSHFYFGGRDIKAREIRQWANERFGRLAGYAQEYLFSYAREVAPDALRNPPCASKGGVV